MMLPFSNRMFFLVAWIAAAAVVVVAQEETPVLVDLSLEFATMITEESSGAETIQELASANPLIRTVLVLQDGQIVVNYTRDDVNPMEPKPVWSTTKSWTGMLMGMLVQDGVLTVEELLGEIFDDPTVWENMTDVEFRQAVTIQELLTMTSGFRTPVSADDQPEGDLSFFEGGTLAGATLTESLANGAVVEGSANKTFHYLEANNILSYVLLERTGMTPGEYLATYVLPYLGIDSNSGELVWWRNAGGVEYAFHGMVLTPLVMAKWGQLYLQQGKSNATYQLLDSEWVDTSTSFQAGNELYRYGYLMWIYQGANIGTPGLGQIFCAQGLGGQDICVSPTTGRVIVQQWDLSQDTNVDGGSTGGLDIASVALDPETTYLSVDDQINPEGSSSDEGSNTTSSQDDKSDSSRLYSSDMMTSIAKSCTLLFLFGWM